MVATTSLKDTLTGVASGYGRLLLHQSFLDGFTTLAETALTQLVKFMTLFHGFLLIEKG
jgi:hypothetical protein